MTETAPAVPTPDFYHYPWTVPSAVRVDGRFVQLDWADGLRLRAFDLWLAENTMGQAIDPATRESVLDPADLPDDLAVATAQLTERGAVVVTWTDGDGPAVAPALFHPGWLRHVAEGAHRPAAGLPEPIPWLATDLGEPPTRDGAAIASDDELLEAWLDDLARYGLARLTGAGTDPDLLLGVGARIGAIRDTNFGPIWDVRASVEPNSTANTTVRLCPHTDLPTRETPPGFQILHCLVNTAAGGWSTMTDGLALVEHLAAEHPEHHEALTTLRWVFFNRGPAVDHRWSGPLVDGGDDRPLTIRAFHPVRGFPDCDEEDQPRAYDALRRFARLAADPRFQLRYPFAPGDVVAFDNRRVLHGRDGYDTDGDGGGRRHLRGIYLDHDEVLSRLRQASRRRTPPAT